MKHGGLSGRRLHLTSEQPITVTARGRTVDEWKLLAGRENHFFDCWVMATVAASAAVSRPVIKAEALAGSPPAPIPEIDPATGGSAISLITGVLAVFEQRRRRATRVA